MILSEIAQRRLVNQQIVSATLNTASELVQWLGAVQAQEYAQAKWGLGLRLPHLTDPDVEKDFASGKILRTHLLRPTWHFVAAQDIRWLLMLTAPRVSAVNAYMYRQLELDSAVFKRSSKILVKTLRGGKQLTRDAINEEFGKNKIKAAGHRLSYIMMYAELAGLICSGARQGNQFTYCLLEERVPAAPSKTRDEALAELAKRYFTSRGPATVKDFSTWSGLAMAECRKGVEMNGSYLKKELIEGDHYYFADNNVLNKKLIPSIHLLPVYDEFIMGYKDRSAIFDFRNSVKPASKFSYDCTIVSGGQVIGTWRRVIKQKAMHVEFEFFKPLDKDGRKVFQRTLNRLEQFTNMPVNYSKKESR